jgi:putative membrane protein
MIIILHLGVLALTILLLARLLPAVRIRGAGTAVSVAVVFSVLNFFLGWLIRAVLFVPVNTALLWLTDRLLANFEIQNVRGLLISAAVITVVNGLFYAPLLQAIANGHPGGGYEHQLWT